MIAEVIVDVSAYPIDRPFDYAVPGHLETVIECGSRVKVPFGPRKVLGYVTGLKPESDIEESKLKRIDELIDLDPVLSSELMALAKRMARETLSYEIDALQVMLPAAMRAKYEKFITVEKPDEIDDARFALFLNGRSRIPLKQITDSDIMKLAKAYSEKGVVSVETAISQQTKVKKVRVIHIGDSDTLSEVLLTIHPNAKKQAELIRWMAGHAGETMEASKVLSESGIQNPVLKAVIERGAATEAYAETYREPDAPKLQDTPIPLQLTDEQQVALDKVNDCCRFGKI